MKQRTIKELYEAKDARRRELAALPMDERVELIDKLHELAVTMTAARESHKMRPGGRLRTV